MKRPASFIDLSGHTARIDPQLGKTGYVRLTLISEQAYSQETGEVIARPQAVEIYVTADQADALADALRNAREAS